MAGCVGLLQSSKSVVLFCSLPRLFELSPRPAYSKLSFRRHRTFEESGKDQREWSFTEQSQRRTSSGAKLNRLRETAKKEDSRKLVAALA